MDTPFPSVWTPEQHEKLLDLCRRYGVEKLWIFGSATTDKFDPARSDLDFQVVMQADLGWAVHGDNLLALFDELPALFGRSVDLITQEPIKNPFLRRSVENSRFLLYERAHQNQFV